MCSTETAYWSIWEILYGVLQNPTLLCFLTEFYATFRFCTCWSFSFCSSCVLCGGLMY